MRIQKRGVINHQVSTIRYKMGSTGPFSQHTEAYEPPLPAVLQTIGRFDETLQLDRGTALVKLRVSELAFFFFFEVGERRGAGFQELARRHRNRNRIRDGFSSSMCGTGSENERQTRRRFDANCYVVENVCNYVNGKDRVPGATTRKPWARTRLIKTCTLDDTSNLISNLLDVTSESTYVPRRALYTPLKCYGPNGHSFNRYR